MNAITNPEEPRFFVYPRKHAQSPHWLPWQVHAVDVVHDPTSPKPRRPALRAYHGFAVFDRDHSQLLRLFVFAGAASLLHEWRLPDTSDAHAPGDPQMQSLATADANPVAVHGEATP